MMISVVYLILVFFSTQFCGTKIIANSLIICNSKNICSNNNDCNENEICIVNDSNKCGSCIYNINITSCNGNNSCSHSGNCPLSSHCFFLEDQNCGVCRTDNILETVPATNISDCKRQNMCAGHIDCASGFICHNYSEMYCGKCIHSLFRRGACKAENECESYFDCKPGYFCFRIVNNQFCGKCKPHVSNSPQNPASNFEPHVLNSPQNSASNFEPHVLNSPQNSASNFEPSSYKKESYSKPPDGALISNKKVEYQPNTCSNIRFCESGDDCRPNEQCSHNYDLPCGVCKNKEIKIENRSAYDKAIDNKICECNKDIPCPIGQICAIDHENLCGKCLKFCMCYFDSDCSPGTKCISKSMDGCGICSNQCECTSDKDCHRDSICDLTDVEKLISDNIDSDFHCGNCVPKHHIDMKVTESSCDGPNACRESSDCTSDSYCSITDGKCGTCQILRSQNNETLMGKNLDDGCDRDCENDDDCPKNFQCFSDPPCNTVCVKIPTRV